MVSRIEKLSLGDDGEKAHPSSIKDLEAAPSILDLEAPPSIISVEPSEPVDDRLEKLRQEYGSTWLSSSDPADPYNFSAFTKFFIGTIFSFGQLIPIMSASMIAPSLPAIAKDLHINATTAEMTLSIYFMGMSFAPFVLASASEVWGRRNVWIICNVWYILWNALCPVGKNVGLLTVGRFMAGAGASAGVTLNGPVMADMFHAKDRGKSLAMVTLLPYLGPALGPIVGGLVTQLIQWEWIFWIMSCFNTVVLLLGILFLRETYTPVLLRRKTAKEGDPETAAHIAQASRSRMLASLLRPFQILIRRPVIWLIALGSTLSFAVYSLMLTSYATLWIQKYHQSELDSSLHYISIAIGATIAGQIGGHVMDYMYRQSTAKANGVGVPEFRLPYMLPGVLIMPIGLFWYGWSAERVVQWVAVDIGVIVFTLGSFILGQAIIAYMIDEFHNYAASAGAAARFFSYLLAFVFPIFAPDMYNKLGYGWGNSVVAFVSLGLGLPLCAVLWFWGAKIRALGRRDGD